MKTIGVIPARYASTRFPGKPLADIQGMPMIKHVYQNASKAIMLSDVVVATDDERIFNVVAKFGAKVIMTSPNHNNGTERVEEVIQILEQKNEKYDVVVNIQGDEPFINPNDIDIAVNLFKNEKVQIATLAYQIEKKEAIDINRVKLVKDINNKVLYFSRNIIPYDMSSVRECKYYQHVGLYAYRTYVLKDIVKLKPSSLEETERLEQLRWIENGYSIYTGITKHKPQPVDVPEDINNLLNYH